MSSQLFICRGIDRQFIQCNKQLRRHLPNHFREFACMYIMFSSLLGTHKRRRRLKSEWYFNCKCQRYILYKYLKHIFKEKEYRYRGIHEKGLGVIVSAVCYTIYTIYLSLCSTAETTSPEPFSEFPNSRYLQSLCKIFCFYKLEYGLSLNLYILGILALQKCVRCIVDICAVRMLEVNINFQLFSWSDFYSILHISIFTTPTCTLSFNLFPTCVVVSFFYAFPN